MAVLLRGGNQANVADWIVKGVAELDIHYIEIEHNFSSSERITLSFNSVSLSGARLIRSRQIQVRSVIVIILYPHVGCGVGLMSLRHSESLRL
jgi:hypothetical protein